MGVVGFVLKEAWSPENSPGPLCGGVRCVKDTAVDPKALPRRALGCALLQGTCERAGTPACGQAEPRGELGQTLTRDAEFAGYGAVSYTHLRAHETVLELVCRLLLDKKTLSITIVLTHLPVST